MCRLCVRITPNNHPTDPKLDAMRTQFGDVVCIVDDDHVFSYGELNCGHYRIIDVPGVWQGDLIYLCDHLEDEDGKMIARRVKSLDVAAIETLELPKFSEDVATIAADRDEAMVAAQSISDAVAVKTGIDTQAEIDAKAVVADLKADPVLSKYVDGALAAVAAITVGKI